MPDTNRYPNREEIREIFKPLEGGEIPQMLRRVSQDVDWTLMGTSPMGTRFRNLQEFQEGTFARLRQILKNPPLRFAIRNIVGGGDQEWASVELMTKDAECKNGMKYPMQYCWVCKFNEEGMITHVRTYLDTTLLKQVLEANECPSMLAGTDI